MKYQLWTTKGRKSADTLKALAAWYAMTQPSAARIAHNNIEAELDGETLADVLSTVQRGE